MKKGFTLVELLAVIVILSIIAIITIPMIKGVIDKVKLGSLEDSVYGLKSAAELYFSSNEKIETTEFICSDNGCISNTGKKLDYKGKVEGKVKLFSDGKVSICLTSDNYASSILANEKKATTKMGGCDEETYEISEVIAIERYNEIKSGVDLLKNSLYNKTIISSKENTFEQMANEIDNVELGKNEEQIKNELYDSLQYSGLVTHDMGYDEILQALVKYFPDTYTYGTGANGNIIAGADSETKIYSFYTKGFKKASFYVTVQDAYYSASSLTLKYNGTTIAALFTNTSRGSYNAIYEVDLTSYVGQNLYMDLVYTSNLSDGRLYVNKIVLSS